VTARIAPTERASRATAPLNSTLFDERCEALGAVTEADKARLAEVDPSTLWRFRNGHLEPRLRVARRIARKLEVDVNDLWPVAA
jgi:DNA-binding XRE family transcriptional regulator